MSEVKKIYQAMVNVANGLRQQGIAKSKQTTGGGNFKYRGIDQVYQAVSPLLCENNIIIRPANIVREEDVQAGKMRLVRLAVTYEAICAEDGSAMTFEGIGEGCDTSDKAAGKALSYAYKTALFQLFAIPVEGQEDTDSVVHEVDEPFIPAAVAIRADELKDAMSACETTAELDAIATESGKLGLPPKCKERAELVAEYRARRDIIKAQNN